MKISILREDETHPLLIKELYQLIDKISDTRVDDEDIELYLDVKVLILKDKPIEDKVKNGELKTMTDLWDNADDLVDINSTPILIEQ